MSRPCFYSTYVCWDMDEYPPPNDHDPRLIDWTIHSAVRNEGFLGWYQIRAYCNELSDETLGILADAGFVVNFIEHKSARVNTMLVDMILWATNTREPSNFIVITKISQHTEYLIRGLVSLKERGSNVYLALPDTSVPNDLADSIKALLTRTNVPFLKLTHAAPGYNKIQVWLCPNLFEKKSYVVEEEEEEEEDEDEKKDEEEEEEEREEDVVLPKPIIFSMDCESGDGKTGIFWDVMDYPLPADLDSSSFYENIESFLAKKGFLGDLFIWAYVPDDDDSPLPPNYRDLDNKFTLVPKVPGDKYARLNKMTVDLLLWAMDNPLQRPCRPNLLVISKNMEENIGFYTTLRGLKSRRYIVFFALPDVAPEEASESEVLACTVTSVLPWKSLLSRGTAQ